MKIILTPMVIAAVLGNALPAEAQQPLTPMQPNAPYTVQPMAPSYVPPRHVTRKRYRRGSRGSSDDIANELKRRELARVRVAHIHR